MANKKIGLFFGSFNPIHVGHLIIASHLVNDSDLDDLWLVVSPQNPLKEKKSLANDYDRLRMVELAIGDNDKIKPSNIEFGLPKPSYTIDTLLYLKEKYPSKDFVLIMGGDNLVTFDKWKNFDKIISDYPLYIYRRPGVSNEIPSFLVNAQIKFIDAPMLDISSTYIRERAREKKEFRYLVPDPVHKYILDNRLY